MNEIYLDFQATTPTDPRVVDAMASWWSQPANPHATENAAGRRAAAAIENARGHAARLIGADPAEICFTSGSTEAANIAIRSIGEQDRVALSAIEHACVRETVAHLVEKGATATTIGVGTDGVIDLDELGDALDRGLDLACVMAVNNEVGSVQPVAEVGNMCRSAGTYFFCDLSQAAGRIPIDIGAWHVDLACMSSHKIYGPQGVGALFSRRGTAVRSLVTGGGQERGLRPGTVPTALAVGFGEACRIAMTDIEKDQAHVSRIRATFIERLSEQVSDFRVHGDPATVVPHTLSIAIAGVDADALIAAVPRLCISTGSACSSGAIGHSLVLQAMRLDDQEMRETVRIGFGRTTTQEDAAMAADLIAAVALAALQPVTRRAGGHA